VLFFSKQHVLHQALRALGNSARVQFDVDLAQMWMKMNLFENWSTGKISACRQQPATGDIRNNRLTPKSFSPQT
jgi:hypothetical protein